MKKKIFILFVLVLLTGCKAKYNLQINFGGNFIETGTIYFNNSLLGKGEFPSEKKEFLKYLGTKYNYNWINKKLPFSNNTYFGYDYYQRYIDVYTYSSQSPSLKALFGGMSVDSDNHHVKLRIGGNKISEYNKPFGDIQMVVEGIEVSVSLPYKVVTSNATSTNKDTNTYTWTFNANSSSSAGIVLEYIDNEVNEHLFTNYRYIGSETWALSLFVTSAFFAILFSPYLNLILYSLKINVNSFYEHLYYY